MWSHYVVENRHEPKLSGNTSAQCVWDNNIHFTYVSSYDSQRDTVYLLNASIAQKSPQINSDTANVWLVSCNKRRNSAASS